MARLLLLLSLLAALALSGCDQECIANCPEVDDDDSGDDDDVADDDDAADDDDTTPPIDEPDPEIVTVRDCTPVLAYRPDWTPGSVDVAGEWNAWVAEPMTGPDEDGTWTIELPALDPGEYAYKHLHNGEWEGDPPPWAYAKWLDGNENRNLRVGDCSRPLLQTVDAAATAAGALRATVQIALAEDEASVVADDILGRVGGGAAPVDFDPATGLLNIEVDGLDPGKHSVLVYASDEEGRTAENEPLWIPLWVEDEAFTWEDALIYFAFVDRFRNGDFGEDPLFGPVPDTPTAANYQGGDFLGVLQALEEGWFEQLGVNVIWLTPVYENPDDPYIAVDGIHNFSGFHGYWPIDPLATESRSGDVWVDSEERLHELIEAAHARGVRVMFDLVLNHVHEDHVYVNEHPEWFGGGCVCGSDGCGWEERALDCWFTSYLPDLDYRNHWVTERVLDDTIELIRRYDVDAVRVDAAKHMDHVVMRSLSRRLRDEFEVGGGAEFYLVGETFTGGDGHGTIMDYVNPWELDGQFDFPLYWTIRSTFAHDASFFELDGAVSTGEAQYGDGLMSPFAGNHDIARLATEIAGNDGGAWGFTEDWMAGGGDEVTQWDLITRQSMALAFTLTQPGAPLLYYGDEIGLAGSGDPDNRRFMTFEPYLSANQSELLGRVRNIGRARAESRAIRRGERRTLWVDDELYVYALEAGDDVAIVALHKGWSERTETIPLGRSDLGESLDDAAFGRSFSVDGSDLSLPLGSWDYAILIAD